MTLRVVSEIALFVNILDIKDQLPGFDVIVRFAISRVMRCAII